jgi:hypothetical protein
MGGSIMRKNRIFWAVVLVCAGFLLLANNLGLLSINIWNLFWPSLLVILGIWFLVGTMTGTSDFVLEEGSVELGQAESASVTIKYGAGRLDLDGSAVDGKLVSGRFANGLESRVNERGTNLDVVLQPPGQAFPDVFFPGNWMRGKGLQWDFGLTKKIPLDLTFETGAADTNLDLSELQVKNLVLKTGASSTEVKLPLNAGTTYFKVEAGAASLVIYVPDGVAARVDAEAGLASVSVDQKRFPKQNGIYQSADYETAENKVDMRIETGMASIEIH